MELRRSAYVRPGCPQLFRLLVAVAALLLLVPSWKGAESPPGRVIYEDPRQVVAAP